ncbi:MAG: hypothetical protein EOL89_03810 [Actinobacteria bacterium]|nr:hypothetical protein [Actinomycetota bacterium]
MPRCDGRARPVLLGHGPFFRRLTGDGRVSALWRSLYPEDGPTFQPQDAKGSGKPTYTVSR